MTKTPTYETLEEAQAEILRLNEALETAKTEAENYTNKISSLSADLENVRTINQQYFLKLSAQYRPAVDEPEEPEAPTCEDFAKTLNL